MADDGKAWWVYVIATYRIREGRVDSQIHHGFTRAANHAEAVGVGYTTILDMYPTEDGWRGHGSAASRCPGDQN